MEKEFLEQIKIEAGAVANEIINEGRLSSGDILVVGCSSSEIVGDVIGKGSSLDAAKAVFEGIYEVTQEAGVFLAAQCCEHLNRALIIEKELAKRDRLTIVNVMPHPHAGGSFATTAYEAFSNPVAVEAIKAQAGVDIGDTLIGMHLEAVAVPVRTKVNKIGKAHVVCARTRAKYIGGERAHYISE